VSDEARERPAQAVEILDGGGSSLLEAVDSLLNRGVVVEGDLVLGLADVDLVYLRLTTLLAAADRILGHAGGEGGAGQAARDPSPGDAAAGETSVPGRVGLGPPVAAAGHAEATEASEERWAEAHPTRADQGPRGGTLFGYG
jgi:hypothetical protein